MKNGTARGGAVGIGAATGEIPDSRPRSSPVRGAMGFGGLCRSRAGVVELGRGRSSSVTCRSFREYLRTTVATEHSVDLASVLSDIGSACTQIADRVDKAPLLGGELGTSSEAGKKNASGDDQQELDLVANEILIDALRSSPCVALAASEENDETIDTRVGEAVGDQTFAVIFDPLDGSRNIECNIPTGTIFAVYENAARGVLRPGKELIAAGYVLYSSSCLLVLTVGSGVNAFTLSRETGEFVLTHPDLRIPSAGQIYSVNDGRYWDWSDGLRSYIDTIRKGEGRQKKQYSARYVCSLVADVHRTLLYGGVAMNPRHHLRLLYEGNPMAFIVEQAGGSGVDGFGRLLDLVPTGLHQKVPVFVGSPEDVEELTSFGNVVQENTKTYKV